MIHENKNKDVHMSEGWNNFISLWYKIIYYYYYKIVEINDLDKINTIDKEYRTVQMKM